MRLKPVYGLVHCGAEAPARRHSVRGERCACAVEPGPDFLSIARRRSGVRRGGITHTCIPWDGYRPRGRTKKRSNDRWRRGVELEVVPSFDDGFGRRKRLRPREDHLVVREAAPRI